MVIPRFVGRALKNEPLQIYGTGKQSRCFAYVGDVVEALIGLMTTPAAAGQVFNIGTTEEIAIDALADKVIALTNSKSQKQYLDYQQAYGKPFDDMMRRVPCLDKIRSCIGYAPKMNLDATLKAVIEDLKA